MSSSSIRPQRSVIENAASLPGIHLEYRSTFLNANTFHTFERDGAAFLYDLVSGQFFAITPETTKLLSLASSLGGTSFRDAVQNQGWDFDTASDAIETLKRKGCFTLLPLDRGQQNAGIQSLERHLPRRIQLLFAQMCNLKCLYCYEEANGSNARMRLMTFEIAKEAVDYLVHQSGPRRDLQVTFFGGEPLLNFENMRRVVAYCRSLEITTGKRFTFETITNGTLLTPARTQWLCDNRFLLMVSLDGYREMNNFNRPSVNGTDYYETILRNALFAQKCYSAASHSLPVKVRANLTHEHHDMVRVVRFLEEQGFRTIGVAAIHDLPWSTGSAHACDEDDLDEISRDRKTLLQSGLDKVHRKALPSPYEARLLREAVEEVSKRAFTRGLTCGVGRNTNIVDCDGQIYPCHRYGDMEPYVVGNVKNKRLDPERIRSYYRSVNLSASVKCQTCWARHLCGGPCAWESSHPSGAIREPDERTCQRIRSSIEESLLVREQIKQKAPHLLPRSACGDCQCGGS